MATPDTRSELIDTRSELIDTVTEALSGGTCVVLVGMPGSGRRAALRSVAERFAAAGGSVRTVAGFDPEGRPLESLALSGVVWLAAAGAATLPVAVQAVSAHPADEPLLLVVEDADRLDETSAAVLAAALRQPAITVAAAVRPPYPGSPRIEAALAARETTVLWMPTLPFEEVHRLVSDVLDGEVGADALGRIYALSGGLPGIAAAIAVEARRAGRLELASGRWTAQRDLWTPAMAVVLGRFALDLTEEQRDACWVLAELGLTDVDTVRGLLPWSVVTALDDRGLVRFLDSDAGPLVALFPPVLEDHLRHRSRSARGQAARTVVDGARALLIDPPSARPSLDAPLRWSSSAEAAAILGRVLREDASTRVVARRAAWERDATPTTAVAYAQALLDDGAPTSDVDLVLAETHEHAPSPSARDIVRLRVWEAVYLGVVQHDPQRALRALADARALGPDSAALVHAVEQHLRLVVATLGPAELPPQPESGEIEAVQRLAAPIPRLGVPLWQTVDVVRLVHGEVLLSSGRVSDAAADFADLAPTDPLRRDPYSVPSLAQLCHGDVAGAVERSLRELDLARGSLDRTRIEPHGYVVALGLYVQGRLGPLRDHLTSLFAVNAPAPLVPESRAGLLGISATLSLWERNDPSARAMIAQLEALKIGGAPFPLMGPRVPAAALAVAEGVPPAEATREAWQRVATLIDQGYLLAAVFDGVRLVDLNLEEDITARLAQVAFAGQGVVLPALGALLEGALARSPEQLLATATALRGLGLHLYSTRAHTMAVRLLRQEGRSQKASHEASHLRRLVHEVGDDLSLVLGDGLDPASVLTAREREVARLIAGGASNREVADRLVVSERTIDNHLYRIFRKLGVSTREELTGLV